MKICLVQPDIGCHMVEILLSPQSCLTGFLPHDPISAVGCKVAIAKNSPKGACRDVRAAC